VHPEFQAVMVFDFCFCGASQAFCFTDFFTESCSLSGSLGWY
jgi:hypothetical protein